MSRAVPGEHGRVFVLAVVAALLGGSLTSVQSRLNGQLSVSWSSALDAALWSFGSGLVLLTVLLLAIPRVRAALREVLAALAAGRLRWWQCIGGFGGAAFVAVQTYAVPLAGVAIFTIAVVGGQTGNSLLVDRLGLGPAGRRPVTPGRVAAAVVAVVGVAVAVSARGGGAGHGVLLAATLAVVVGACTTVQQATNGQVNRVTDSTVATTWLNFATGSCFLVALALVHLAAGTLAPPSTLAAPWWAWFGGLLGMVFIAMAAVVVRHLGMLVFTLVMLTGQLSAAVGIDLLSPRTRGDIGAQVVAGVLITLVAAYAAGWSANRERVAAGGSVAG